MDYKQCFGHVFRHLKAIQFQNRHEILMSIYFQPKFLILNSFSWKCKMFLTITQWVTQRLSPDIRITRNPDLPGHFGTRIPDTPNPGTRMSDEHYFNAFFGSFLQKNGRAL